MSKKNPVKKQLCLTDGVTLVLTLPPVLAVYLLLPESGCHVLLSPFCLQALDTALHSSPPSPSWPSTFLDAEPSSHPLLPLGNVSPYLPLLLVGGCWIWSKMVLGWLWFFSLLQPKQSVFKEVILKCLLLQIDLFKKKKRRKRKHHKIIYDEIWSFYFRYLNIAYLSKSK